jgi:hypothetical protein
MPGFSKTEMDNVKNKKISFLNLTDLACQRHTGNLSTGFIKNYQKFQYITYKGRTDKYADDPNIITKNIFLRSSTAFKSSDIKSDINKKRPFLLLNIQSEKNDTILKLNTLLGVLKYTRKIHSLVTAAKDYDTDLLMLENSHKFRYFIQLCPEVPKKFDYNNNNNNSNNNENINNENNIVIKHYHSSKAGLGAALFLKKILDSRGMNTEIIPDSSFFTSFTSAPALKISFSEKQCINIVSALSILILDYI